MTSKPTYVVTAPYITVRTGTADGLKILGFYVGAVLPGDVSEESIKHHLDSGLIAAVKDAEKELAAQPDELPSSTGSVAGSAPKPAPAKPASK
jgi:hypothetical protein